MDQRSSRLVPACCQRLYAEEASSAFLTQGVGPVGRVADFSAIISTGKPSAAGSSQIWLVQEFVSDYILNGATSRRPERGGLLEKQKSEES
ncbi:hypothetical protein D7M11_04650 [Paenibacillus ginsengarvi]|uniref:Uncharacterized protein n=1 Tax=Paenibacillus ginsengarvi TaxID=400777 RepID=A0A3B0CKU3_9BACL|nr:hypothetical protein D7M11_04650 [Paenibacillus ginsengarvi]